ncbi:MAG: hypothetical protein ACOX4U_00530 [Anaerovoracaceae bacterium]|jgi:hypothetical protein
MDSVYRFYTLKPWRDLSYKLKIERGGKCERCGYTATAKEDWSKLIAHHRIELAEHNISDPKVALNPEKIEIICQWCHNKNHRRFGHEKKVYIVWGAPLSGKSTLVKQVMRYGDIVVDIDRLWTAVSMQDDFVKPDNLRFNLFALRDNLLDQIKTRHGQWYDAYVIGGYPDKCTRERVASILGAELISCESTKEECLARRKESGRPSSWDKHIEDWFSVYERTGR